MGESSKSSPSLIKNALSRRMTCDGLPGSGKTTLISFLEGFCGGALFTRQPLRWEEMSTASMMLIKGYKGHFYDRSPYFLNRVIDILERYEGEKGVTSIMESSHIG